MQYTSPKKLGENIKKVVFSFFFGIDSVSPNTTQRKYNDERLCYNVAMVLKQCAIVLSIIAVWGIEGSAESYSVTIQSSCN